LTAVNALTVGTKVAIYGTGVSYLDNTEFTITAETSATIQAAITQANVSTTTIGGLVTLAY
jgi:hypothetical protein